MNNIVFIPVRGGSKSIPLKNIKKIAGKPLVYWVAKAACECVYVNKVYIATDSIEIRNVIEQFISEEGFTKIAICGRSQESSTDTASTELAMLEFAKQYDFDNIALVQATSPLLTADDLAKGFEKFNLKGTDSVMSVVHQYRFNWSYIDNGDIEPLNYDIYRRPRRQNFDGYLVENGAFYITSKDLLLKTKNRISGHIKPVEMNEDSFLEIDEPADWDIIENLLYKKYSDYQKACKPKNEIKIFLSDVDGCLTDGGMYYSEMGDEIKKFNTRDGMAFDILRKKNIITGIISGENVNLNRRRAEKLNLDIIELGCKDKASKIRELAIKYKVKLEDIVYVGDDVNDVDALSIVGIGCCPADANEAVKKVSKIVTETKGGTGVIREIVDKVI